MYRPLPLFQAFYKDYLTELSQHLHSVDINHIRFTDENTVTWRSRIACLGPHRSKMAESYNKMPETTLLTTRILVNVNILEAVQ